MSKNEIDLTELQSRRKICDKKINLEIVDTVTHTRGLFTR